MLDSFQKATIKVIFMENNIQKYINYCNLNLGLSKNTIKAYYFDLISFNTFLNKEQISTYKIESFNSYMVKNNLSPRTRQRKLVVLKSFCEYLFKRNLIESNPFDFITIKVKIPKDLPKTVSSIHTRKILEFLYDLKSKSQTNYKTKKIIRDILIFELLIGTGIRVSELCNIKMSDLNLKEKYILINGKGKKERIVFINTTEILSILREHLKKNSSSKYLFLNKYDQKLSEQSVRLMIKDYCKTLHINELITPHLYRHTFATYLAENDVNLVYIQNILGHSSISTTEKYTHFLSKKHYNIMKNKNPRKKIPIDNK